MDVATLNPIWLRDNCPCPECRHESGQRLLYTRSLPDDLTGTSVPQLFGFVRETNYGRLFDVKTVVNPTNLAYTGLGLGAHTDNPYRDPTPTLQLLHCLASSAEGGENTLVDSFRVAQALPGVDFELLASRPIRFRYADAETELESETPVISLDARGDVQAVHYNTRSAQAFRLAADE